MNNGMQLGPAGSNSLPNNLADPTNFSSNATKVVGVGCAGTKSNGVAASAKYAPYNMKGGKRRRVSRRHRRSTKHRRRKSHRRSTKHRRHKSHRRSTKHRRRKSHRRRHKTRRLHGGALNESLDQKSTLIIDSKGYSVGSPVNSGNSIRTASALANPPPIQVYQSCPKQSISR